MVGTKHKILTLGKAVEQACYQSNIVGSKKVMVGSGQVRSGQVRSGQVGSGRTLAMSSWGHHTDGGTEF